MSAAAAEKKPRENDRDTEKEREKEWGEKQCKEAAAILEGVFRREPLSLKCFVASRGIYLYEAVVLVPVASSHLAAAVPALPAAYSQIRLSSACPHLG